MDCSEYMYKFLKLVLLSELKLEAERQNLAQYPELQKYFLIINDDIEQLQMLKINLDSWNKAYEIASNIKFKTWATDKKITFEAKGDAKATRAMVKANLKKVTEKILIFNSKEANEDINDMYEVLKKLGNIIIEFGKMFLVLNYCLDIRQLQFLHIFFDISWLFQMVYHLLLIRFANDMYEVLKKLGNIIIEFGKMFEKRKKDKNIVDFSDVEHFALQILLKEELSPSF